MQSRYTHEVRIPCANSEAAAVTIAALARAIRTQLELSDAGNACRPDHDVRIKIEIEIEIDDAFRFDDGDDSSGEKIRPDRAPSVEEAAAEVRDARDLDPAEICRAFGISQDAAQRFVSKWARIYETPGDNMALTAQARAIRDLLRALTPPPGAVYRTVNGAQIPWAAVCRFGWPVDDSATHEILDTHHPGPSLAHSTDSPEARAALGPSTPESVAATITTLCNFHHIAI